MHNRFIGLALLIAIIDEIITEPSQWKEMSFLNYTLTAAETITGFAYPFIAAGIKDDQKRLFNINGDYYTVSFSSLSFAGEIKTNDRYAAYVFCGADPNPYILINKQINMLKPPFENTSKPFCFSKEINYGQAKIISALFTNSAKFFYYEKSWVNMFQIGTEAYAMTLLYYNEPKMYYYSFVRDGDQFKIKLIGFENKNAWDISHNKINPSFVYSANIIDVVLDQHDPNLANNKIFIFSYDENTPTFAYYVYSSETLLFEGNGFSLKEINNMIIVNAEFLPMTGVVILHLRNTKGSNYITAIDLLYNLVVYSMQKDITSFNVEKLNTDGRKQFFHFFIGNSVHNLCPFAFDLNSKTCSMPFSNEKLVIDLNQNTIKPLCDSSMKTLSKYCVTKCTIGYATQGSECSKCQESLNYENDACVSQCSEDKMIDSNHICYLCSDYGLKLYINNCIENCSAVYAEERKDICYRCKTEGHWFEDNKCVEKCSNGCEAKDDNNECVKCSAIGKVLSSEGKCADECKAFEVIDQDSVCRLCEDLDSKKPFYQDGICVEDCSLGYEPKDNTCLQCKNENMFFNRNNRKCEEKCPSYYLNDSENICYSCIEKEGYTYYELRECVDKCTKGEPSNDGTNTTVLYCRYCKDEGLYLNELKCEEHCPQYNVYNSDNVCYTCSSIGKKYQNEKCIDECGEGYAEMQLKDICEYCKDSSLFYHDKQCLELCPRFLTFEEEDHICFSCYDRNSTFNQNGKCTEKCAPSSEIHEEEHYCNHCSESKIYFENGKCVNQCQANKAIEGDEECIYCYAHSNFTSKQYVQNKKCVVECSEGYELIPSNAYCKKCNEDQYYSKKQCVDSCPLNTVPNANKICNLCYCSNHGKCEDQDHTCKCDSNFYGTYCQMEMINSELIITASNAKVLSNQTTVFSFIESQSGPESEQPYQIKWSIDGSTEIEDNTFINGFSEISFELQNRNLKNNRINVTKSWSNKKQAGCIDVSVYSINKNRFQLLVQKGNNDKEIIPMNTTVTIRVVNSESDDEEWSYQFFYVDEYKQMLPLTDILHYNYYTGKLPVSDRIIAIIKNSREEDTQISLPMIQSGDSDYDLNVNDILDLITTVEQMIKLLKKHFYIAKDNISDEEAERVFEFINKNLIDELSSSVSSVNNERALSLKEGLFSILNIITRVKRDNSIFFKQSIEIIKNCIQFINDQPKPDLSHDTILSIVYNIDTIIDIAISNINASKENNDINFDYETVFNEQKDSVTKLASYISRGLSPGQQVRVIGKNFNIFIDQPGREQALLSIPNEDFDKESFDHFSDYVYEYKYKLHECSSKSFFCINAENYQKIITEVAQNQKTAFGDLAFQIIVFKTNPPPQSNSVESYQVGAVMNISLYDKVTNETIENVKELKYRVRLSLKEISNEQSNTSNYACVPLNKIESKETYCYSFFDLAAQEAICLCNHINEIGMVHNESAAYYYKHIIQYPPITLSTWNYFSGSIVSASVGLIIIVSILLLIMDLYSDHREQKRKEMTKAQKIKYEYESIKHFSQVGVWKFALFLTYYKYPLLNVFSIYKYDLPRFFRFFLEMFFMLLSLFLSSLPYHLNEFELKNTIINMRYSSYESLSIHNIPSSFDDYSYAFFYSFVASVLVFVFAFIVHYLLRTHIAFKAIWKPKLDLLKDYIYCDIKKDVLLTENWNTIRNRILAVSYFLKTSLDKKIDKDKNKHKQVKYLLMRKRKYNSKDVLEDEGALNYGEMNTVDLFSYNTSFLMLDSQHKAKGVNISKYDRDDDDDDDENSDKLKQCNDTNANKGVYSSHNYKCQLAHSFALTKSLESDYCCHLINKFEKIKGKYIDKKDDLAYMEEEEDDDDANDGVPEYKIVQRTNYTYIAHTNIQANTIIQEELNKIRLNITYNCALVASIIALSVGIVYLLNEIYIKYEYFIVKAWLLPSVLQIIFFRLVLSYVFNLIRAIVIAKTDKRPTQFATKFVYELFIEKSIVYLNKIKNLITKYQKEFSCLE